MGEGPAKPSYLRAAFSNPLHLSAFAGLGVAALALGAPFVVAVAAAEAAYLAVVPNLRPFRRRVEAEAALLRRAERTKEVQLAAASLPGDLRARVQAQLARVAELEREAVRDRPVSGEFLKGELSRLDEVVAEYVHLHLAAWRAQSHLAKADVKAIAREREQQRRLAESAEDPDARRLAGQNADVLGRRLELAEELARFVVRARARLSLVENTLALVRDQVMTLAAPERASAPLGELVAGIEAMREATREVERMVLDAPLAEAGAPVAGESAATAGREREPG